MPLDWEDEFYAATDWERGAYVGGDDMPEHLDAFFERVGVPDDVASVGCGPAHAFFVLAERYPDVTFYGYDYAPTVLDANREKAREDGLDNLHFERAKLPDVDLGREFDLVYCMATLYFVRDVERAVERLYEHVRSGGHLVFNYPNVYTRRWAREETTGSRREAFSLVAAGENLLSYDRIEAVLGRRPRSYWTAVDAREENYARRSGPPVYVRKP